MLGRMEDRFHQEKKVIMRYFFIIISIMTYCHESLLIIMRRHLIIMTFLTLVEMGFHFHTDVTKTHVLKTAPGTTTVALKKLLSNSCLTPVLDR